MLLSADSLTIIFVKINCYWTRTVGVIAKGSRGPVFLRHSVYSEFPALFLTCIAVDCIAGIWMVVSWMLSVVRIFLSLTHLTPTTSRPVGCRGTNSCSVCTGFSFMIHQHYTMSQKNSQNCFCHNFVKFSLNLIIFGMKMAKTMKLCKVHSLSTSLNLC